MAVIPDAPGWQLAARLTGQALAATIDNCAVYFCVEQRLPFSSCCWVVIVVGWWQLFNRSNYLYLNKI
jgi:hypothetical protein